ncbi:MAG TPA: alanine racemase [Sporomusa sp.]|nr:alanine racemase [Sporomusa sp.]HWR43393.1 alanine racemase [Sporomusa sp.]
MDLDKLELNIREMAELCKTNGKKLCPMVKTHKSTGIAALQAAHGSDSFLVGTLDEAERLQQQDYQELVLAYPVAAAENIARVINLAKRAHVILSFDGVEAAAQFEAMLLQEQITMEYLIIIDCGLHRFGVQPDSVLTLAQELSKFSRLKFKGIATHPGHVYGKNTSADVVAVAKEEIAALEKAADLLSNEGFAVEIVATGSTPTGPFAACSKTVTTLRPGNYTFYDAIQVALGVVPPERCSLTVLATVIANPGKNLFIIDAGSKCLGLDKGAHSVSLVNGYGIVKDHPELMVESLSEEVGKIRANGNTGLKVGDKIEIIPNHACAAANMTSFLTGHRNGIVEKTIAVDARGGANRRF